MNWTLRITKGLLKTIRSDLARQHAFAGERVGFLFTRLGNQASTREQLVLTSHYWPVPDDNYIDDPSVGARYAAAVHRRLFERAHEEHVGVFHVHAHEHAGRPRFSSVDLDCIRRLVPSLRTAQGTQAHGGLLLSDDSAHALCWLPGARTPAEGGRIVVIGRPLEIVPVVFQHV